MSKITLAYEAIVARMQALFPNHFRLTNPYDVENNDVKRLNRGWGVQIGPSQDPNDQIDCEYSIIREINIVLTRRFYAKEHDVDLKDDGIQALLEDAKLIFDEAHNNPTLGVPDTVANFQTVSDNGIETVFSNKECFLKLQINCTLRYFESYT